MPVFRKAKKFAGGGKTNSIFNNPGIGLGLQYIPTQQELPDLEGLMYMEESKQKALAQFETIRKERIPDVSELTKKLDETEIFGGVRDSMKRRISKDVQDYMQRMNTDPEFAFSMEARTKFTELKNKLDSGQVTYQGQRFKEFTKDWEKSVDKDMGEEMYVSNGKTAVVNRNDPDDVRMINVNEVEAFLTSEQNYGKFSLFSQSKDLYDHVYNNVSENFKNLPVFSSRISLKDAKEEIESVFKNVAHSKMSKVDFADIADKSGVAVFRQLQTEVKDNGDQLKAAISQTYQGLSRQAKDALLSHYTTKSGDFSQDGFDIFLHNYLSGEEKIRKNTETSFTEKNDVLSGDILDRLNDSNQLGEFTMSKETIGLKDGNWWKDMFGPNMINSPILGKSSIAYSTKVEPFRNFPEAEFVYNDLRSSSKYLGRPANQNISLHLATKQGDFLVPTIEGTVYREVADKDTGVLKWVIDDSMTKEMQSKKGHMITATDDDGFWFRRSGTVDDIVRTPIEIETGSIDANGNPVMLKMIGYKNNEGYVMATKPIAYAVYNGFQDKDKTGPKDGTTIFVALDPTGATQKFGRMDWSKDYKEEQYFNERTLKMSKDSEAYLYQTMQGMSDSIIEWTEKIKDYPEREKAIEQQALGQYINHYTELNSKYDSYRKGGKDDPDYVGSLNVLNQLLNYHKMNQETDKIRKNMTSIQNTFRATTTYNNLQF